MRDLVEVVVHRLAAALLRELAARERFARIDEAERDAAPGARVGRVPDVGRGGEAGLDAAGSVLDVHAPDAAALAGEPDLEGERRRPSRALRAAGTGSDSRIESGEVSVKRFTSGPRSSTAWWTYQRASAATIGSSSRPLSRSPRSSERPSSPATVSTSPAATSWRRRAESTRAVMPVRARRCWKPTGPAEQVAHQHERPLVADPIERARDRVEDLARPRDRRRVGGRRHSRISRGHDVAIRIRVSSRYSNDLQPRPRRRGRLCPGRRWTGDRRWARPPTGGKSGLQRAREVANGDPG